MNQLPRATCSATGRTTPGACYPWNEPCGRSGKMVKGKRQEATDDTGETHCFSESTHRDESAVLSGVRLRCSATARCETNAARKPFECGRYENAMGVKRLALVVGTQTNQEAVPRAEILRRSTLGVFVRTYGDEVFHLRQRNSVRGSVQRVAQQGRDLLE